MPFAVAGHFEPISPVYGTVFWGVITAIILILIVKKTNKTFLPHILLLTLLWYPLLQTSRWAWNPNLIPLWIAFGIWFFLRKTAISYFLSGICLGLAFHQHYLAVIATGIFVVEHCIIFLKEKKFRESSSFIFGYILPFLPFIFFDLRHPPGLFFNHYLMQGNVPTHSSVVQQAFFVNLLDNIKFLFFYLTQNNFLAVPLGGIFLGLLLYDVKHNRKAFLYIIPVAMQIIVASFINPIASRYIWPAILFLLVWVIMPRKLYGTFLSKGAVILLIVGSFFIHSTTPLLRSATKSYDNFRSRSCHYKYC